MHCHCDYVCDVGGEVCIGLVFTMVAGNIMDQDGRIIIVIFVLVAMVAYSHAWLVDNHSKGVTKRMMVGVAVVVMMMMMLMMTCMVVACGGGSKAHVSCDGGGGAMLLQ